MNRYWLMTLAFCAFMSNAKAQKMTLNRTVINCGQTAYRLPVSVEYEVMNEGNKPLFIQKVESSCGCTQVVYPKTAIEKGQKGKIIATFDANQLGTFEKYLLVYSNADERPALVVFKGKVVEEIQDFVGSYPFTIGDLKADRNNIEFDDVNRGDMPQEKIHIKNTSKKTLEPVMMHLPPYIKADLSPSKLAPNQSGTLVLTLNSHLLHSFGLTQTSVFVGMYQGDKVSNDKEITLSAVLLPSFDNLSKTDREQTPCLELSADTLDLSHQVGKNKKKGEITLKNTGKSLLDIGSIQMFTMGLRVDLNKTKLKPNDTATLKVVADSSVLANSKIKPRVLMITNDPNKAKVVINIKL